MSKDLVSKESVLKIIEDIKVDPTIPKNYGTLLDIMRQIRNLPTVCDVDKDTKNYRGEANGECHKY